MTHRNLENLMEIVKTAPDQTAVATKIARAQAALLSFLAADTLGVQVEYNLKKALAWCDVANVLRIQLERQQIKYFPSLRKYTAHFGINRGYTTFCVSWIF